MITESAQEYLADLLSKQETETNIKIFVSEPGSPKAETCIVYCKQGEQEADDQLIELEKLSVFLEKVSLPFLEDTKVDYSPDKFGGQLTIRAPNAKTPALKENSSIEDKINYYLYSEINPSLASHGGEVNLVEVLEDSKAGMNAGLNANMKTIVIPEKGTLPTWSKKAHLTLKSMKDFNILLLN